MKSNNLDLDIIELALLRKSREADVIGSMATNNSRTTNLLTEAYRDISSALAKLQIVRKEV